MKNGIDHTSVHIGAPMVASVVASFRMRTRFTFPVVVFATVPAAAAGSDDFKLPVPPPPPPPEMAPATDWKPLKIAAIVVGSFVGVAVLLGTLVVLYRRHAAAASAA